MGSVVTRIKPLGRNLPPMPMFCRTIIYSYFGIYKRVIPGEKLARKEMVGWDEAEDVRKKLWNLRKNNCTIYHLN